MAEELTLTQIREQLIQLEAALDLSAKQEEIVKLQVQTQIPDFWSDEAKAKNIMKRLSRLQEQVNTFAQISSDIKSLQELESLSADETTSAEIAKESKALIKRFRRLKLHSLLSGPYDDGDAILSVHSGQGGTEAMDWAAMLMRMYQRFFERQSWQFDITDELPGDEAGIKTVTFLVNADYAYGYLKSEAGTHRLVRQSPFNADNLRQTSFALVEVLPSLKTTPTQIDLKDEELEWQFFRSSGKGGQNVNKVSTAVRLTHKPTGITVTSQSQRHQEQNRKIALEILTSKLWQQEQAVLSKKQDEIKGDHKLAGWGNQIRSYVLHPYHLVKDTRTDHESTNTDAVLDGDIKEFIDSYLLETLNP